MDLDGDGLSDVFSGAHHGEVFLFRGRGGGQFAPNERLTDANDKPLKTVFASTVHAVDWDADDDHDLLVGSSDGDVHLFRNQGSRTQYSFGEPEQLTVGGEPILVPGGRSCPAAADWDGDGQVDLLVGGGDGRVVWYRNVGTAKESKLAAAGTLVPAPEKGSERGIRAKICVTDWNGDSLLDLVVGDHGDRFEKELSEEERLWREEARRQKAELLQSWAVVFRRYRQLLQSAEPDDAELREQREQQLTTLREQLQQLNQIRDRYHREEESLEPGTQYHGRVWLFLRT